MGQVDVGTVLRMSLEVRPATEPREWFVGAGCVLRVPCHGLWHRSCALLCRASCPRGAAASGPGCDGEGEREPDLLVPACTWWQVLPTPKLVECTQVLQSDLLPSVHCAVRHQIMVGSGNLCGSARTCGIHPGLAEWQKNVLSSYLESFLVCLCKRERQ